MLSVSLVIFIIISHCHLLFRPSSFSAYLSELFCYSECLSSETYCTLISYDEIIGLNETGYAIETGTWLHLELGKEM